MSVAPTIRRIVTGHDANGNAIVVSDAVSTRHKFPDDNTSSTLMWITRETPCDIFATAADPTEGFVGTPPPANGTRFTIMEFQPGARAEHQHRTDTVDYVICLTGEVTMDLDEGKVVMRAGDVMIQCGTNHGWSNYGTLPARVAFVLIDGKPLRDGSVKRGHGASTS
jgi:quercetin dioxygenase-like cupin family protein